jgi:hypothetical protein
MSLLPPELARQAERAEADAGARLGGRRPPRESQIGFDPGLEFSVVSFRCKEGTLAP